ncbi:MAG: polymerase [Fibrobacteria bacterium]|jgi:DNA polymerase-4|nr:polymerase [Fibrobacteria bacterium]
MPRASGVPETLYAAVSIPRFTAQALSAERPELRRRPFVVVEQNASSHKTLVRELSEEAGEQGRRRHIWPGLPVFLVARKWPGLPVLARDPAAEARLRDRMRALWTRCTPEFTVRDNGGALLDMTGTPATRKFPPETWALHLQLQLYGLGLDAASVGVASSQAVARVLARLGAPRGVHVCPPGEETRLLDPLSPALLPDLSSQARERLRKYGLDTIAAVRRLDRDELVLRFGAEGDKLYVLARGMDLEPVAPRARPLSVETVLPLDLNDETALRNQVRLTADKLGHALRLAGLKAGRFTLVLVYADGRSARRTARLAPTAAFGPLAGAAVEAFFALYRRRVALRRLQLHVAVPAVETGQRDLFEEEGTEKREALEAAVDRIRKKLVFGEVLSASSVESYAEEREREREEQKAKEKARWDLKQKALAKARERTRENSLEPA